MHPGRAHPDPREQHGHGDSPPPRLSSPKCQRNVAEEDCPGVTMQTSAWAETVTPTLSTLCPAQQQSLATADTRSTSAE